MSAHAVVPGSPSAVRARAAEGRRAGRAVRGLAAQLRSQVVPSPLWTGEAADAFRGSVADLPGRLEDAASAFEELARVLEGWADRLAALQARAAVLLREQSDARRSTDPATVLVRTAAADRALARLREEVDADAAAVARAVDRAAAAAPVSPGRLRAAVDRLEQVEGWLDEHADALDRWADALGTVAAVLAVGALVATGVGAGAGAVLAGAALAAGTGAAAARTGAWRGGAAAGWEVARDVGTAGVAGAAVRVGSAAGAVPRALFVARAPVAAAQSRTARVVVAADRGLTGYGGTALLASALHRDPGGGRAAGRWVPGPPPVGYGLPGAAGDAAWRTALVGPGWTRVEPVRGPVLGPPLPPQPGPAAGTGTRP